MFLLQYVDACKFISPDCIANRLLAVLLAMLFVCDQPMLLHYLHNPVDASALVHYAILMNLAPVASLVEAPSIKNLPIVLLNSQRIVTHATKPALELMGCDEPALLVGRPGKDFWVETEKADSAMEEYQNQGYWYGSFLARHNDGLTFMVHGKAWMIPGATPDDFATLMLLSKSEVGLELYSMFGQEGTVVLPEIIVRGAIHDLNNANSIFKNIVPMIQDKVSSDDKDLLDLVSMARQGSEHVSSMINKLGSWLAIWTRKETAKCPLAIGELVQNALELSMIGCSLNYSLSMQEELAPVMAEETTLFRVFINMFLNAREALSNSGTLKISVENRSRRRSPRLNVKSVVVKIQDDGNGMTPQQLKSLFKMGATTKTKGRGVGLAISEHIIRDHGGYIDVQSELHRGTTFEIWLPAV